MAVERTISEISSQALVATETRSLPVKVEPTDKLLFAVTDAPTLLSTSVSVSVIKEHPEAIQTVMALAFYHPDLINLDEGSPESSDLSDIRQNYPTIVKFFGNQATQELLQKTPIIASKVADQRQLLDQLPTNTSQIKDIELVMQNLIEISSSRSLSAEDRYLSTSAHALFDGLSTSLMVSHEDRLMSPDEEKLFFGGIGQKLLRTVRLFEINTSDVDLNYQLGFAYRETRFRGTVAQMVALNRMIGAMVASKDSELTPIARNCKKDLVDLHERAILEFPEKYSHLLRYAWVEVPGAAEMDKSDMTDFLWGGNG